MHCKQGRLSPSVETSPEKRQREKRFPVNRSIEIKDDYDNGYNILIKMLIIINMMIKIRTMII